MKRFEIGDVVAAKNHILFEEYGKYETIDKGEQLIIEDIIGCSQKFLLIDNKGNKHKLSIDHFAPYKPKFEVGDIVTNYIEVNIGYCPVSKGAIFEVVDISNNGYIRVKRKNATSNDDYDWGVKADRFIMCNPRAYME